MLKHFAHLYMLYEWVFCSQGRRFPVLRAHLVKHCVSVFSKSPHAQAIARHSPVLERTTFTHHR